MLLLAPLISAGCSTLNTADHNDFSCDDGDCPTPLEVYLNTNSAPPSVSVGRTPDTWGVGNDGWQRKTEGKREGSQYLQSSLDLISAVPESSVSDGKGALVTPLRQNSQTMRVWIAPWVDMNDNLHWNGFVFTEVSPRQWAVGEQEVRHQSTLLATPSVLH